MKTKILFLGTIYLLALSSCGKKIDGTVKDNFGNPVENANVIIKNSDFKTLTNNNGSFSIDYVAGKVDVEINKSGFRTIEKNLEITEKSDYPLGTIEMFKYPDSLGVYLIGEKQYSNIKLTKLSQVIESKGSYFKTKIITFKLPEDIKFEYVEKVNTDKIKFAIYQIPNILHPTIVENNIVSLQVSDNFGSDVKAKYVKYNSSKIENNLFINDIPKKDNIYCIIPIRKEYVFVSTDNVGFCFMVRNDSLFVSR